jgi:hypothetical protein
MRTRTSLVAVLAAAGWASAALAAGPGQIYNDYVRDGHLSCSYSRGELESVLRSGSINQYGDPLTLARLKLAVRKQLAGGCRTQGSASRRSTATTGGSTSTTTKQRGSKRHKKAPSTTTKPVGPTRGVKAAGSGGNGSFIAGRVVVVGLLALALAFGGWLTKRGLNARG